MGFSIWYVLEMRARAAYYKKITQHDNRIEWFTASARELSDYEHAVSFLQSIQDNDYAPDATIPEKKNQSRQWRITKEQRNKLISIYQNLNGNPEELGQYEHKGTGSLLTKYLPLGSLSQIMLKSDSKEVLNGSNSQICAQRQAHGISRNKSHSPTRTAHYRCRQRLFAPVDKKA
jgi:hypothetical protein